MKIRVFLILLPFLALNGCASSGYRRAFPSERPQTKREALMRSFLSDVVKFDGIDQREAAIIAKSELMFRQEDERFYLDEPHFEAVDEDNWGIRFYPVNRSAAEARRNPSMLVVVNKETGRVRLLENGLSYMFREE